MQNRYYGNFEANDVEHSKQTYEEAKAQRRSYERLEGNYEANDLDHSNQTYEQAEAQRRSYERLEGNYEANDLDHSNQTYAQAEAQRRSHQRLEGNFESHDLEHRDASDEVDVRARKEKEAPVYEQLNEIIKNGLPQNSNELKNFLTSIGCREDFICYLLENEKQKFTNVSNETNKKYDQFNSDKFNKAAFEYLAIINALEELGASNLTQSYYDTYNPYYVDLDLLQIAQIAWTRAKNGADINVPIPKGYDFSNPQSTVDLVKIIDCTEKAVNKNKYIKEMWKQIGYVDVNENKKSR